MSWCPWRELGLAPRASTDEVKTAFKRLAFTHHPDKHVNSPAREQASAEQRFRVENDASRARALWSVERTGENERAPPPP